MQDVSAGAAGGSWRQKPDQQLPLLQLLQLHHMLTWGITPEAAAEWAHLTRRRASEYSSITSSHSSADGKPQGGEGVSACYINSSHSSESGTQQ